MSESENHTLDLSATAFHRKPSVVMQPLQETIPRREKTIEELANGFHQAVADDDVELQSILRALILNELDLFEQEETDRDPGRAKWICPVMRSTVYDAFGEYQMALECDLESLMHGRDSVEQAKSAINACIGFRRLGQYDQAVKYGLMASDLQPHADWVWVYLAMALYKAGNKPLAGEIIASLADQSDIHDPRNALRIHLRFDQELREMADLPQVSRLIQKVA
jgi:tetratricopeptide (TPR) repeat protein